MRADAADTLLPDRVAPWLAQLRGTVSFVRAERGMFDQPGGLYPEEVAATTAALVPQLETATVTGVNHYTIVLSPTGAAAVAQTIRDDKRAADSEALS